MVKNSPEFRLKPAGELAILKSSMNRLIVQGLFLFSLAFSFPLGAKPTCVNWQKVYATATVERLQGKQPIFWIEPFRNITEKKGDDWLKTGLPYLLLRAFETAPGAGSVWSPFADKGGLRRKDFRVGGHFQKGPGWIKVYVELKNPEGKLLAQYPLEVPYPHHIRFFTGMAEIAGKIFKGASLSPPTPSVPAFENTIRGLESLWSYDPPSMEVALIWFQESLREDRKFAWAREGLIEVYGFLKLEKEGRGQSFAGELEKLSALGGRENRFLGAYSHAVNGNRALSQGAHPKAVAELERAIALVPEDPRLHYSLSQAYAKLGNGAAAAREQKKAREMNRCLR